MKSIDAAVKIGKLKFDYWAKHPDEETKMFNESISNLAIMSWVYNVLVTNKKILPLEKISEEEKINLKAEANRIDPLGDVKKRMQICKAICVYYWISNNV